MLRLYACVLCGLRTSLSKRDRAHRSLHSATHSVAAVAAAAATGSLLDGRRRGGGAYAERACSRASLTRSQVPSLDLTTKKKKARCRSASAALHASAAASPAATHTPALCRVARASHTRSPLRSPEEAGCRGGGCGGGWAAGGGRGPVSCVASARSAPSTPLGAVRAARRRPRRSPRTLRSGGRPGLRPEEEGAPLLQRCACSAS